MEYFIKSSHNATFDDLKAEQEGLEALEACIAATNIEELSTPKIIRQVQGSLYLEKIEPTRASETQWFQLGVGLAKLHSVPQAYYGWHKDNFIGLGTQLNTESDDWPSFFIEYRLLPQINRLKDSSLKNQWRNELQQLKPFIEQLLKPQGQKPALLHGDLWSGNVMFSKNKVWLIDPAVYIGDGEVDVAMTELFGGFSPQFYEGYQTIRPLSAEYPVKKALYNLYHALNHLNLFGDSYKAWCDGFWSTLQEYSQR